MPRNKSFRANREPFRDNGHKLRLDESEVEGPVCFFNPTRACFIHPASVLGKGDNTVSKQHQTPTEDEDQDERAPTTEQPAATVKFLWRSRDNRKGRHALLVQRPLAGEEAPFLTPRRTSHPKEVAKNIWRTLTYFPVWDISWLVAFVFTWGSVVWVLNGFFVWLPIAYPSTEFNHEVLDGGGITAFIGAILFFETGSILLMFEAVNENSHGCFGWAVEQLIQDDKGGATFRFVADRHHCVHHQQNRRNFVGKSAAATLPEIKPKDERTKDGSTWQWFPSWHALKTHYLHELGFLASTAQFVGATIFGIAGFTALPGVNNHLSPQGVMNGVYWIPQVVGGSGFIVSSTLYMLETQKKWYLPAFHLLGWHVGFWNLIGALGFTLSGALGMAYGNSGAQYEAALATFWGSFAFLTGSYLQLYESLDTHPVEEVSS